MVTEGISKDYVLKSIRDGSVEMVLLKEDLELARVSMKYGKARVFVSPTLIEHIKLKIEEARRAKENIKTYKLGALSSVLFAALALLSFLLVRTGTFNKIHYSFVHDYVELLLDLDKVKMINTMTYNVVNELRVTEEHCNEEISKYSSKIESLKGKASSIQGQINSLEGLESTLRSVEGFFNVVGSIGALLMGIGILGALGGAEEGAALFVLGLIIAIIGFGIASFFKAWADGVEEDIDNLESKLNSINSNVADLEAKLNDLKASCEQTISKLEAELEKLKNLALHKFSIMKEKLELKYLRELSGKPGSDKALRVLTSSLIMLKFEVLIMLLAISSIIVMLLKAYYGYPFLSTKAGIIAIYVATAIVSFVMAKALAERAWKLAATALLSLIVEFLALIVSKPLIAIITYFLLTLPILAYLYKREELKRLDKFVFDWADIDEKLNEEGVQICEVPFDAVSIDGLLLKDEGDGFVKVSSWNELRTLIEQLRGCSP